MNIQDNSGPEAPVNQRGQDEEIGRAVHLDRCILRKPGKLAQLDEGENQESQVFKKLGQGPNLRLPLHRQPEDPDATDGIRCLLFFLAKANDVHLVAPAQQGLGLTFNSDFSNRIIGMHQHAMAVFFLRLGSRSGYSF